MQNSRVRGIFVLGVIVLAIAIAGWFAYDFAFLRVTLTDPQKNNFPTFAQKIDIYFNHNLDSVDGVKIDGKDNKFTKAGNKIYIPFGKQLDEKSHEIEISNAKSGFRKSKKITIKFKPKYVEYKDLSESVANESIKKSNSGQVDDPFMNNMFPLLPREYDFTIDAEYNEYAGKVSVKADFLAEVTDPETGITPQVSNDQAETLRNQVYDYIRSLRGIPEKYDIIYSNRYLNSKYSGITY